MFIHFFIKRLSIERQVLYLKKNGVYLGQRTSENRRPHLYMLGRKIAEVVFEKDDNNKNPEKLVWIPGLQQLESHLEKEFKSSF
jgi:hypothetical protein